MCKAILFFLAAIAFMSSASVAQKPDEIRKQFPNEELVYYNYSHELKLSVKNDVPVAESRFEKDLLILSEKNAALYNRQAVYHSTYNELTSLEAYTRVPDGNQYKKVKVNGQKTTNSPSNSVFYDDIKETSFDFLSLTRDAVGHVEYTQFHKDAHLLTPFYLPGGIPIVEAVFSLVVPNDISIKYVVKNDPGPNLRARIFTLG